MIRWPQARPLRRFLVGLTLLLLAAGKLATAQDPIRLKIIGGLGGVSQFTQHEAPFWREKLPALTGGAVVADIEPFDRSGIRAAEIPDLLRLGVLGFSSMPLGQLSAELPEATGFDLIGASADAITARRIVDAFRPIVARRLKERYRALLLGVWAYPAQILFCNRPIDRLADLKGLKVRTSSATQIDFVEAAGGIGVQVPFAEIPRAVRQKVVDCAITGSLSGNQIGLHEVTTHLYPMPINWGFNVFAAGIDAWGQLPETLRDVLERELPVLESAIWTAAERETLDGIACNVHRGACVNGRSGAMTLVPIRAEDETLRRRIFYETILPRWVERCGESCGEAWLKVAGPLLGLPAVGR